MHRRVGQAAAGVGPGAPAAVKRCRAVRPADDGALDDFEDGNNQITKSSGRDGYWWSAADPKGSKIEMQTTEPGAGGSEMAMHMIGTTVPGKPEDDSWGVQLGVNFVSQGMFYDASKYAGIAFKAKVGAGVDAQGALQDRRHQHAQGRRHLQGVLEPLRQGPDADDGVEGIPGHVLGRRRRSRAGAIPARRRSRPNKLIALNWQVGPGQTYDIWIDDVTFLDCE